MSWLYGVPLSLGISLLLFNLLAYLAGIGQPLPEIATETLQWTAATQAPSTSSPTQTESQPPSLPQAPIPPSPMLPPQRPPTPAPSPVVLSPQAPPIPQLQELATVSELPMPALDMQSLQEAVNPHAQIPNAPTSTSLHMDLEAMPRQRQHPQYPRRALLRGIQGQVLVEFIVDEQGQVVMDSVEFIEAEPAGIFETSVRRALTRWHFQPRIEQGQARPFRTRQRLEFTLD
ncbi:protein TonB [Allopseudospirillum japonicum]|uniref:Protein TonB n=1 Tax=Allopseudospirillum japonicum TaxID=64971 RepID=A0A1H6TTF4_9GAMM|nr:energy transducer TonB [Allopseudospirillum japonicum]SEI83349.1 protein TonB [Allopseudospirillum japonicum]